MISIGGVADHDNSIFGFQAAGRCSSSLGRIAAAGRLQQRRIPTGDPAGRRVARCSGITDSNRHAVTKPDFDPDPELVDEGRPSPVVFGVDSAGVGIIRGELLHKAATEAARELAATATGRRFAAITAAAVSLAEAMPGQSVAGATGPERIQNAVAKDRGGKHAPENPVGFGS